MSCGSCWYMVKAGDLFTCFKKSLCISLGFPLSPNLPACLQVFPSNPSHLLPGNERSKPCFQEMKTFSGSLLPYCLQNVVGGFSLPMSPSRSCPNPFKCIRLPTHPALLHQNSLLPSIRLMHSSIHLPNHSVSHASYVPGLPSCRVCCDKQFLSS